MIRQELQRRLAWASAGISAISAASAFYATSYYLPLRKTNLQSATRTEMQLRNSLPPAGRKLQTRFDRVDRLLALGATDDQTGKGLKSEQASLAEKIVAIQLNQGEWALIAKEQQERATAEGANKVLGVTVGLEMGTTLSTILFGSIAFSMSRKRRRSFY